MLEAASRQAELIECSERATLDGARKLCRPGAFLGNDIDHAADGVRAVEGALRSAQYLDPLDPVGQQVGKVEDAGRRARIADIDAIDEDLGLV